MEATMDFGLIVEQQLTVVRTHILGMGIVGADVDDVIQETFLALHQSLHKFDPLKGNITAFTLGIATHRSLQWLRTSSRRSRAWLTTIELDDLPSSMPSADLLLDQRDKRALLDSLLSELSDTARRLLVGRELLESPMGEVAAALDLTEEQAWTELTRAKLRLAKAACRWKAKNKQRRLFGVVPSTGWLLDLINWAQRNLRRLRLLPTALIVGCLALAPFMIGSARVAATEKDFPKGQVAEPALTAASQTKVVTVGNDREYSRGGAGRLRADRIVLGPTIERRAPEAVPPQSPEPLSRRKELEARLAAALGAGDHATAATLREQLARMP